MSELPKNLIAAVRYFADLKVCNDYMRSIKWPDGVCCHHCGSTAVYELSTRPVLKCRDCEARDLRTKQAGAELLRLVLSMPEAELPAAVREARQKVFSEGIGFKE